MEYSMEDYEQEQRNTDARRILTKLKLELACRENNEHIGSGLGGNPSEYLFMLTHTVKATGLSDGGEPRFNRVGSEEIVFFTSKKPSMKEVRRVFTKFLDENFPNRLTITQAQLINPSFIKDLGNSNLEMKLFIRALEHTQELAKWFDLKRDMQNKLLELKSQEQNALASLFLKEMNLPETYFEDHKDDKKDPMSRLLNRHPVWGVKKKAVDARYSEMCQHLLSSEDKEKMEMIGAYPEHIALFAFRACIGIDRIVSLDLDEQSSCKFLVEINKLIEDGSVDEE